MPKLTINGKEVQVPEGTNLIEAAKAAGADVPHYCYHPALSIAGQCRLCMVDIDKVPRPQIACNTQAAEGMVVHTETERVKETRRSMMEFHLIMTREDYNENTKEESRMGPIYVVDISRKGRPLALMIHPGQGTLATDSTQTLIRAIIDSVKPAP